MSECRTGAGNQEFQSLNVIENLKTSCLVVKFDRWDMLNKFCFHVHAHKSLFIAENCNAFFFTSTSTPSPVTFEFIELVPS